MGIQDFVVIVIQLASGDAKFSQGEGRVSECPMGVLVIEVVGEFGDVIKLPAGVQGDSDQPDL